MPVETETQRSQKAPKPRQFGNSFILFITTLLLLNFIILPAFRPRPPQVPYSDFIEQIEAGQVARAIVSPNRIQYMLKPKPGAKNQAPLVFETTPVALDLDLPRILRSHDVEFAAPPPTNLSTGQKAGKDGKKKVS